MTTAQITLSEAEDQAIFRLSQSQGKTREEILHAAIEQFLAQHQSEHRLVALQQARGIWRQRRDLPDFATLRKELDR